MHGKPILHSLFNKLLTFSLSLYILGFECHESADLVFVVDSSGSITGSNSANANFDNWSLTLQFIASFVNQLDIGPSKFRVGVVT